MISLYDSYLARCHQSMLPGKLTIFLIASSLHHILVVQYRNHLFLSFRGKFKQALHVFYIRAPL